jgi:hypothetical protein
VLLFNNRARIEISDDNKWGMNPHLSIVRLGLLLLRVRCGLQAR